MNNSRPFMQADIKNNRLLIKEEYNLPESFVERQITYPKMTKEFEVYQAQMANNKTGRLFYNHNEVYKNKNGLSVLIISPYKGYIDSNFSKEIEGLFMAAFGFKKICSLYSKDAYTYIKIGYAKHFDYWMQYDNFENSCDFLSSKY